MSNKLNKREHAVLLLFAIAGFLILGLIHFYLFINNYQVTPTNYFWTLVAFTIILLLGNYAEKEVDKALLFREVDSKIDPEFLVEEKVYFLNGQAPTIYLGTNNNGVYLFQVLGLKSFLFKDGVISLERDLVIKYVSSIKEIL